MFSKSASGCLCVLECMVVMFMSPPPPKKKNPPSSMPRGPPNCAAQQNWPERFGNISPHLHRLYKRRWINNVSVEGAALHMKVSWLSSPRCRKWGGDGGKREWERERWKWLLYKRVKCTLVLRTLCRHYAFQSCAGESRWRGRGEHARPRSAWKHNKPAFFSFFFSPHRNCENQVLVSLPLIHTFSIQINTSTVL